MQKTQVYIRENSWLAKIAARRLGYRTVAMVLGRTIHLYGVTAGDFLRSPSWVRHELKHVEQYRQRGFFGFLALYLWECLRRGYYNNRLEQEAREAESDERIVGLFELRAIKKT